MSIQNIGKSPISTKKLVSKKHYPEKKLKKINDSRRKKLKMDISKPAPKMTKKKRISRKC